MWRKKIAGRQHSFGPLHDPVSAYRDYLRNAPRLRSGRPVAPLGPSDDPTVHQVATAFLTAQRRRLDLGEITPTTFRNLRGPLRTLISHVGRDTPVSHLGPEDFSELMHGCATRSPAYRDHLVGRVRQMFRWSSEHLQIPAPTFGLYFRRTPRHARERHEDAREKRLLSPPQFWSLVHACDLIVGTHVRGLNRIGTADALVLRAALLLAINGGVTQSDLSELRLRDVDPGWTMIVARRHKTGIPRAIPLWPETAAAIRLARTPRADDGRLLTLPSGRPLVTPGAARSQGSDTLSKLFVAARAAAKLGAHDLEVHPADPKRTRPRYLYTWRTLRYTFDTVAMEVRDDETRRIIMGHGTHRMDRTYVQNHPRARLEMVSAYVRAWLLGTDRVAGESMEDHAASTRSMIEALSHQVQSLQAQLGEKRGARRR